MKIQTQTLTPADWNHVEHLFGSNGACGGCWCMHWRVEKGERWEDLKGQPAKSAFRKLVISGKAKGVLAFDGAEPIGWCAVGPRVDFARLQRSPTLACEDPENVWSITCFFVRRNYRGKGVASALLVHACALIRELGGRIAEGYPVDPREKTERTANAFAWTGTLTMFEKAKFTVVGNPDGGKKRVRRALRPTSRH